ncbi:DUF695 domain-containing protein [Sphingomonas sp. LB-2]|uniref:DUF695 domain-containing protein n=1 Tax=Sphingomonas caeni TaxID=2984949 RepID=UPI002231077D|nr:DUF695 domain-containing protein [Sphingomonas caeni]MCW3846776.1 DUF695 domain-containing protein [Sphingomonas caeni]
MAGKWDFYFCLIEDQPASIYLDLALIERAPIRSLSAFAYIRLYMNQPRPDGLSSSQEFETLSAIDDALVANVTSTCGGHYAGRTTSDGARTYYFYPAKIPMFEGSVVQAMRAYSGYEFEVGHRDDPEWLVYRDFLYPSAADRQRMLNRDVLEALRDHGDRSDLPREIDHWIFMPDRGRAMRFAQWAEAQGFVVSECEPHEDQYKVRLIRIDAPTDIDEVTLPLHERAVELGGNYDGWECPVEAPEKH